MTFHKQKLSLAAAETTGLMYVICAIFVALWPDFSLRLLGWVTHIVNVDKFAGDARLTVFGFLGGLAQVLIYTYIAVWIFASFYNRSLEPQS